MDSYTNIPGQLKQRAQWVAWGIKGEPPKAPYNPTSLLSGFPQPAKAGVRETWGTFQSALQCVSKGLARGIGYEFDGQALYGVDLDSVLDGAGTLMPQAQEIVEELVSYTEISPSGKGLHILVNAFDVSITRHRRKGGFLEIYNNLRYFTITGNLYGNLRRIETRSGELQRIHDKWLLPAPGLTQRPHAYQQDNSMGEATGMLQVGLSKDPVMRSFWMGEHRRGDESSSDQALMNKLAYWCSANQPAMIQAFLASPYHAQKDDAHKKKCQRTDYLPKTASHACVSLRSTAREDHLRWRRDQARCGRNFER